MATKKSHEKYIPLSHPVKGAGGETGSWRKSRPVVNYDKCTKCQLCWVYCPDAVIDRQSIEIDYQYCKGCGVCACECPVKAIDMVDENSFEENFFEGAEE